MIAEPKKPAPITSEIARLIEMPIGEVRRYMPEGDLEGSVATVTAAKQIVALYDKPVGGKAFRETLRYVSDRIEGPARESFLMRNADDPGALLAANPTVVALPDHIWERMCAKLPEFEENGGGQNGHGIAH